MRDLGARAIEVSNQPDVYVARQAAKAMAHSIGFDDNASEEIAIAVSELASNLVKHATQGTLTLTAIGRGERVGILVESMDQGPGIRDVERAIGDGFSTTGSLGYGLGAINRIMDGFHIVSEGGPSGGTHVLCTRWAPAVPRSIRRCPLDFGAASRPRPGLAVNGDAFVIKRRNEMALVGVIDGLGHGPFAQRAAQSARQYVESHFDQPLEHILRGAARACRATRGAVMALARFDWEQQRLSFASVGNVEAHVFGCPEPVRFIMRRGIIGLNAPRPVVTEHRWRPDYVMVLHSDGLASRWQWEDFPELAEEPATLIAQRLLRALARDDDDATVVVVRDELK